MAHVVFTVTRDLPLPADSRSLFELLARQKVISKTLSVKLAAMAGFRNILVHEYLEIDRHRVYQALTAGKQHATTAGNPHLDAAGNALGTLNEDGCGLRGADFAGRLPE